MNFKDYLAPFDFEKCPKSGLEKPIYELFEEISNITMYQKAMNTLGIDTTVLPFSDVKKDVIVEAKQILMDINEAVNEGTELSKLGMKADYESLLKNKEKISELSSSYYELIPHT